MDVYEYVYDETYMVMCVVLPLSVLTNSNLNNQLPTYFVGKLIDLNSSQPTLY